MSNKSKLLKRLLTTASALAVITGGASSALGAAQTVNNPSAFNTPGDWSTGVIIANGDIIQHAGQHAITADINAITLAAIDISGQNLVGKALTLSNAITNLTIGSIGDNASNGGAVNGSLIANSLPIIFGKAAGGQILTLTGTVGVGLIAVDNYDALASIDYGAGAQQVTVQATSGNEVTLYAAIANGGTTAGNRFDVNTSVIDASTNGSISTVRDIRIAGGATLTFLNQNVTINTSSSTQTKFLAAGSILKFSSTGGLAKTITFNRNLDHGIAGGIVELNAGNNASSLILVANGGNKTLGTGVNKLTKVQITGTQLVNIENDLAGAGVAVLLTNVPLLQVDTKAKGKVNSSALDVTNIEVGVTGKANAPQLEIDGFNDLNGALVGIVKATPAVFKLLEADSRLIFSNTSVVAQDLAFNLASTINVYDIAGLTKTGGSANADARGIIEVSSTGGVGKIFEIRATAGQTLGYSDVSRLKQLIVTGNRSTTISANVFAKDITISGTGAVTFGDVAGGNGGAINIGNNGTINLTGTGATLFGANIAHTITGGTNSVVTISGNGDTTFGAATTFGAGSTFTVTGTGDVITQANFTAIGFVAGGGNYDFGNGVNGATTTITTLNLANTVAGKLIDFDSPAGSTVSGLLTFGPAPINVTENVTVAKVSGAPPANVNIAAGKTLTIGGASNIPNFQINNSYKFAAGSKLQLQATGGNDQEVTLIQTIDPGGAPQGILSLLANGSSIGAIDSKLTLKTNNPAYTIGTNVNALEELQVSGDKTVIIDSDLRVFTDVLVINNGSTLIDLNGQTITAPGANNANVGIVIGNGGAGTLIYRDKNLTINAANAVQTAFLHANSILQFESTDGTAHIITLGNNMDPGAGNSGIVVLRAENVNSSLVLQGAAGGETLGTGGNSLKELRVNGGKQVVIRGNGGADAVDLTNIDAVTITEGTTLTAETDTIFAAPGGGSVLTLGLAGNGGSLGHLVFNAKNAAGAVNITGARTFNFAKADSSLTLYSSANNGAQTFTLNGAHFDPTGNNTAVINLRGGVGEAGAHAVLPNTLTLNTAGLAQTLGTGAAKIQVLNINNNVTIHQKVDLQHVKILNVKAAGFAKVGTTAAVIPAINIGEAVNGAGVLGIDISGGNTALLTGANVINFLHDDSTFVIYNDGIAANTATLHANLTGGVGADDKGRVILWADNNGGNKALTIAANAGVRTLGDSAIKRLQLLELTGDNNINVNVGVFAKKIEANSGGTSNFAGVVNTGNGGSLEFTEAGTLTFAENTTLGNVNFGLFDGIIEFNDAGAAKTLSAKLNGSAAIGTLKLKRGTLVNSDPLNASTLKSIEVAASGPATLGGKYVTDIKAAGANALNVQDGFQLTGNIIKNANALDINFLGSAVITGDIGADGAVGDITFDNAAAKTLTVGGDVNAASLTVGTGGAVAHIVNIVGAGKKTTLDDLTLDSTGATVTLGETEIVHDIIFTLPGTLTTAKFDFTAANAFTFTADGTANIQGNNASSNFAAGITAGAGDTGTLNITGVGAANTLTFTQAIGTAANTMKRLSVDGKVKFDNEAHILDLDAEAVTLANAGGDYTLVYNGAGKDVTIAEDVTLQASSQLGTNAGALSRLVFSADKTLTIGNNVNIYAGNIDAVVAAGQGALTFEGASIIGGAVGSNKKLKEITVKDAGHAQFNDAVNLTAGITLGNNSKITFKDNVTTTNITGINGEVRFLNANAITFSGKIGDAAGVEKVTVGGANVTVTGLLKADAVDFNANAAATLTLASGSAITTVTTVGNNIHTLAVNGDFTATTVGAENNRLKVHILQNGTVTASGAFYAGVTTENDGSGIVRFGNGSLSYDLGTNEKSLSTVEIKGDNAAIQGDVYARAIGVDKGKSVTLGIDNPLIQNVISGNVLTLGGEDSAVRIADNTLLNISIVTTDNGEGNITFSGDVDLRSSVGSAGSSLETVTFSSSSDKNANIYNSIYADNIIMNNSTGTMKGNAAFVGAFSSTNGKLNLNDKNLNLTGDVTLIGSVEISTTYDGNNIGNIKMGDGNSTVDLSGVTAANVVLNAAGLRSADIAGTTVTAITLDGTVTPSNVDFLLKVDESSNFIKWTGGFVGNTYQITAGDNTVEAIQVLIPKIASTFEGGVKSGSNAEKFLQALEFFSPEVAQEASDRLEEAGTPGLTDETGKIVSNVMSTVMNNVNATLGARLYDTNIPVAQAAGDGDPTYKHGIWASGSYGRTRQQAKNSASGYAAKTTGFTAGWDTMANDNLSVGIAGSLIDTKVNFKNGKIGDKAKADTKMISMYGYYGLPMNYFSQVIVSYASSDITSDAKRRKSNTSYEIARGKYTSTTYAAEVLGGYDYNITDTSSLTPMVGLRYSHYTDASYTETGTTTGQNLSIRKDANSKFEGIAGARVSMLARAGLLDIVSEAHAFGDLSFNNKTPKVNVRIGGAPNPLPTRSSKSPRGVGNVGGGITTKYSYMDYGIVADAYFGRKFISWQASIKLRAKL